MTPQVSCVSGTVEGRLKSLQRLIRSVRRSVGKLTYEIILIPCGCSEVTLNWIKAQKDIRTFEFKERPGSGPAFQKGFEMAQADSVVTLNDDVSVGPQSIHIAYNYLQQHPEVGQVAFGHKYQNRRPALKKRPVVQGFYGYPYGQCCMTRRYLGEWANWCGLEHGWNSYAWDTHLGLSVWQEGYKVAKVARCWVTDWEIDDDTRRQFAKKPRQQNHGVHPDLVAFKRAWEGKMPPMKQWIPVNINRVLHRAALGTLRTLRFKGMFASQHPMRHGMIDALAKYGPAKQINQDLEIRQHGVQGLQQRVLGYIRSFQPDLVIFQSQRPGKVSPQTIQKARQMFPGVLMINWDADPHYPLTKFHAEVARASDLQLVISPTIFDWYIERGAHNIGYWPISVEPEYLEPPRNITPGSPDVTFMGSVYPKQEFPEGPTRIGAVKALLKSGLKFRLHGGRWSRIGIRATQTHEDHSKQARIYANSKMALSISQVSYYWGYSSDRLYNISAAGCVPLLKRFEGMEEHGYIHGETCVAWETIPEMLELAKYYSIHDGEREAIAISSRELIKDRHTWDHRVQGLLTLLDDLGGYNGISRGI